MRYSAPRCHHHPCRLLTDVSGRIIPNVVESVLEGHTGNVKCIDFLGEAGQFLVSGSSDHTVRIWPTTPPSATSVTTNTMESGRQQALFVSGEHTARVWDVVSSRNGQLVASASADSTIKVCVYVREKET